VPCNTLPWTTAKNIAENSRSPRREVVAVMFNPWRTTMKFLCLVYFAPDSFDNITPDEQRRLDDATIEHDNALRASGNLLLAGPLTDQAIVMERRRVTVDVTDGPYAETKEVVGGFMLMEAESIEAVQALLADDPINAYGRTVIRPVRDGDLHSQTGQGRPDFQVA
jgi:hypothetical protein